MSSRTDLRVSRALALLAELRAVLADFAKREDTLLRDLRNRRGTALRKHRDASEKAESRLAARTAETTEFFTSAEDRNRARYKARGERVQKLYTTGLKNLPKRAQQAKQRWMGDLQMKQFRADRKQITGKEAADKLLAQCTAQLTEQRTRHDGLQRTARNAFSGFGAFLWMLRKAKIVGGESQAQGRCLAERLVAAAKA